MRYIQQSFGANALTEIDYLCPDLQFNDRMADYTERWKVLGMGLYLHFSFEALSSLPWSPCVHTDRTGVIAAMAQGCWED